MVCVKCPHYHSVSQVLYFPALTPTPTHCEMNIWVSIFSQGMLRHENLRNSLCTRLLRKAHALLLLQQAGHQAARSETWVTALHPGTAASPASQAPAPQLHIPSQPRVRHASLVPPGLWGWAPAWIPEMNRLKIMLIINCCINTAEGWWTARRRWDLAGGKCVFGQLCCGNPRLSDCSSRLQQGCERSSIDRILRSWFVGTFKHFSAVTAVNLNSIPFSATFSYSTFEDDRECNARSACDPCSPVPCCKHWAARFS